MSIKSNPSIYRRTLGTLCMMLLVLAFGCGPDDNVGPQKDLWAANYNYSTIKGGKIKLNLLKHSIIKVPGNVEIIQGPEHGRVKAISDQADAQYEYHADNSFEGKVIINYRLRSEYGISNTGKVTIDIVDCATHFAANNDTVRTSSGTTTIPFSAFYANDQSCPGDIDFQSLTLSNPYNATVTSVDHANELVYIDIANLGWSSIDYSICNLREDTISFCDNAVMHIEVVDSCELIFDAKDDIIYVKSNGITLIPVDPQYSASLLYNDIFCLGKIDFQDLRIEQTTSKGSLVKLSSGNLEYAPYAGASGADQFIYKICANANANFNGCMTATVTIYLQN